MAYKLIWAPSASSGQVLEAGLMKNKKNDGCHKLRIPRKKYRTPDTQSPIPQSPKNC